MKELFQRLCKGLSRTGLTITGCFMLMLPGIAVAELMIYPTRLVIEGNQRATKVELINNSTETATYRIMLVNRRMDKLGAFSDVEAPREGEQFADKMLRYSPRQVTLSPGAGQTVRLMVRKPGNLDAGEYRSHLMFSRQPDLEDSPRSQSDGDSDGVGVQIRALVGATIPVIVRHGATEAEVQLKDLEVIRHGERIALGFVMERSGNRSVYGDIVITLTPDGGSPVVVGRANGVAVYTPNARRVASVLLDPLAAGRFEQGTLKLVYREQAEDGARVLAQSLLKLP